MTRLLLLAVLCLLLSGCGGGGSTGHATRQAAPTLYEKRWFVIDGVDVRKFWDGEYWCELPPGPPTGGVE
jgi:hypothetical protein